MHFLSSTISLLLLCAFLLPVSLHAQEDDVDRDAIATWAEGYWEGAFVRANSVLPIHAWLSRIDDGALSLRYEYPDWVYYPTLGPDTVRVDAQGRLVWPDARYGPAEMVPDTTYQEMIGQSGSRTPAAYLHLKRAVPPPASQMTEEVFRFESDGLAFEGELHLPPGDGPHPGIVLSNGGRGCVPRYRTAHIARELATYGIAAVAYDQRGSGASEGDCDVITFETMADDAFAAYRTLGAHPRVDASRIGFWGSSAGNWWSQGAMEHALDADDVPDPAFMIGWVGMGTSIRAVQYAVKNTRADRLGLSDDARQDVLRVIDVARDSSRSNASIYEELTRLQERGREDGWLGEVFNVKTFPDSPAAVDSLWWQRFRFEPARVLKRMDAIPYLAIFGRDDPLVPFEDNALRLRRILQNAGNEDVRIVGVDAVGHGVENPDRFRELPGSVQYYKYDKVMPRFFSEMITFLRAQDLIQ